MAMKDKKKHLGEEVNRDAMEEYYTIGEVSNAMKLSRTTVYRFVKRGILSAIKVSGSGKGGTLRFRQKDMDIFNKKSVYRPTAG